MLPNLPNKSPAPQIAAPAPTSQAIATQPEKQLAKPANDAVYALAVDGDLGRLSNEQRIQYLTKVSESLGLNPMTRPFGLIKLDGKVVLYALKEAATQLAKRDNVSVKLGEPQIIKERNVMLITATARTPDGRETDEIAAVAIGDKLVGEAAANAYMKLATKAKRRVVLTHCGLGMLDESELDTVPRAQPIRDEPPRQVEAPKPPPPATPGTRCNDTAMPQEPADVFVEVDTAEETAPAVSEPVNTAPAVIDAFDYNNVDDRQWLIDRVKGYFPKIKKGDALNIIGTFAKAESKSGIDGVLKARLKVEEDRKAKGQPSLLA